ncbi:beta-lactamase domain-containing protein 2-like [Dreissena polymorpha]|nr:beta-lactamase domain-containing protein 2-like [Dreissena polymorpha]
MGLLNQAIFGMCAILTYTYIIKWTASNLPTNFGGSWEPEFQDVVDVFRKNVESGKEKGGAFAVYYKGRPVIDVWGGYADAESYRPWTENTTTMAFSCTKGVAAILLVKMMELGIISSKSLVKDYWPEFAVNGKDNITVEMLISHQAGLIYLDTPLSLREYLTDREKWSRTLADQSPAWPPGAQFGYHALTFGLYVDELIQRTDPNHRDTATIFQDLIAKPFGIDFGMNTPLCEFARSARLVTKTYLQLLIDSLSFPRYLVPFFQIVAQPKSVMAKSVVSIVEYAQDLAKLNNPLLREITVSSASGTGTARGLARLYGILANGGSVDGDLLLSRDSIKYLATPIIFGKDSVFLTGEDTSFGPGTLYRKNPKGQDAVGHTGHGGQVANW